jgi:hypothetical protein
MKCGEHFNNAFRASVAPFNYVPDDAAIAWMVTANFRAGNQMDTSATPADEVRYQHRGYAKYADIARVPLRKG